MLDENSLDISSVKKNLDVQDSSPVRTRLNVTGTSRLAPSHYDPETTAFFPGCSLRQLAPQLTETVHYWLVDKGYCKHLYRGCCGLPLHFSEQQDRYKRTVDALLRYLQKKGIHTLLVSCPNCYYSLRTVLKEDKADVTLLTLPHLFVEAGLALSSDGFAEGTRFMIHDSCPDIPELLFSSDLHTLAKGLNLVEEPQKRITPFCCGAGGDYYDLCLEEQVEQAERRLGKATEEGVDVLLTCCASCRYALSLPESPLEVYHYLEVLFHHDFC